MLNQVILIGRVSTIIPIDPILNGGYPASQVTLTIQREYKNVTGTYDSDDIVILMQEHMLDERIKEGTSLAVKGRLEIFKTRMSKKELIVIAERLTYISKDFEPQVIH